MTRTDKEFIRSVVYFWTERDDPTRYCYWDVVRCKSLMPAFYEAWRQHEAYRQLANLAAGDAGEATND